MAGPVSAQIGPGDGWLDGIEAGSGGKGDSEGWLPLLPVKGEAQCRRRPLGGGYQFCGSQLSLGQNLAQTSRRIPQFDDQLGTQGSDGGGLYVCAGRRRAVTTLC